MKRLAIGTVVALVSAALALAAPVAADSSYRIPLFGCADGAPGFNIVPANTPLFVQSGWVTGTKGLVTSAIVNSTDSVSDVRGNATTIYAPIWGPVVPFSAFPGAWVSFWRVDLPALAPGATATVTMTLAFAHPQVDLGLPTSDDDQTGLQYFDRVPPGLLPSAGEPNPVVCTITAV